MGPRSTKGQESLPYGNTPDCNGIHNVRGPRVSAVRTTTTPGREDGDDTAADERLFRAIGLHRVLHSGGGAAGPFRRACFVLLSAALAVHAVQVAWLPAALHDFRRLTYTAVMLAYGLMTSLKGFAVLHGAPRLLAVLDAARASFARSGRPRPGPQWSETPLSGPMLRCRDTVRRVLRPAVVMCYGTFAFWAAAPWFLLDERVAVPRADGTVARYRATVNNMWYPMPEAAHNSAAGWAALYAVEALVGLVDVAAWTQFDCYLVAVCFVLNARFGASAAGCAALGHGHRGHGRGPETGAAAPDGPSDITLQNDDSQLQSNDIQLDYYEELISLIQDNQNIMKKFDDFFDVVRPLIILQIVISSFSVTAFTFFISLMIYSGQPIISVTFFKFAGGLILLTIELFICCYGFSLIESAKSTLNFGLYSCNWTEMDLKFQKTMLIAMTMNSAHKRVMRVSPNSIIHLEMFTEVLRMSLSTVSVLLNLNK